MTFMVLAGMIVRPRACNSEELPFYESLGPHFTDSDPLFLLISYSYCIFNHLKECTNSSADRDTTCAITPAS